MANETNLPFKVGGLAEAKTFEEGFRGAWFHCKIRDIAMKKGRLQHLLEYYDFPDEKWDWTSLYQVPPPYHVGRGKEKHRELILRPPYPPIYNEKQIPHVSEISEVIVIVNNSWKVGDMVDWWAFDCYWSGEITELLGDDKAKIGLKPPPFGEGSEYTVSLKDVRPSLDWSPHNGWTIPAQVDDRGAPCARLIKPTEQVIQETRNTVQETDPVQGSAGSSAPVSSSAAVSDEQTESMGETVSKQLNDVKEKSALEKGKGQAGINPGLNSADSGPDEDLRSNRALKKYRASDCCFNCLNSSRSDTLEATIMDLEEYVNKVRWLKKILEHGFSSCDGETPQWEFVDPNSSSEKSPK